MGGPKFDPGTTFDRPVEVRRHDIRGAELVDRVRQQAILDWGDVEDAELIYKIVSGPVAIRPNLRGKSETPPI
jgi:hypothetical protein